jgi:hypothetical protein
MHVVIANERFLPRFGVDRMLLTIAQTLRRQGHEVTLICTRCDRAMAEANSDQLVVLEMPQAGLREIDEHLSKQVLDRWNELFSRTNPSVVLIGGWPFFSLAAGCAERRTPTIFGDAGAVPHDGLTLAEAPAQQELRRLRALSLPRFTAVTPISEFIADSQSAPDRGGRHGLHVIHLGGDHLSHFEIQRTPSPLNDNLQAVRDRKAAGACMGFVMGRWEPHNYKNSVEAFDVARTLRRKRPDFFLTVLADSSEIEIPHDLQHAVVAVGRLSDTNS